MYFSKKKFTLERTFKINLKKKTDSVVSKEFCPSGHKGGLKIQTSKRVKEEEQTLCLPSTTKESSAYQCTVIHQ
jgi:hypothetical protein